jgi:hypothetical protein
MRINLQERTISVEKAIARHPPLENEPSLISNHPQRLSAAVEIFEGALAWLNETYRQHTFFVERDVVWTLQLALKREIQRRGLPLRVFNDYAILKGKRRGLCADLAILNDQDRVEVAAEFKYEPDHRRRDIRQQKLPVVGWKDMQKDILRIGAFPEARAIEFGYTVFIDEGAFYRRRQAHAGSSWIDWPSIDAQPMPSILFSRSSISADLQAPVGSILEFT